jgi:hypothetical protein
MDEIPDSETEFSALSTSEEESPYKRPTRTFRTRGYPHHESGNFPTVEHRRTFTYVGDSDAELNSDSDTSKSSDWSSETSGMSETDSDDEPLVNRRRSRPHTVPISPMTTPTSTSSTDRSGTDRVRIRPPTPQPRRRPRGRLTRVS